MRLTDTRQRYGELGAEHGWIQLGRVSTNLSGGHDRQVARQVDMALDHCQTGLTYEAIAQEQGITKERVRQLVWAGLERLEEALK